MQSVEMIINFRGDKIFSTFDPEDLEFVLKLDGKEIYKPMTCNAFGYDGERAMQRWRYPRLMGVQDNDALFYVKENNVSFVGFAWGQFDPDPPFPHFVEVGVTLQRVEIETKDGTIYRDWGSMNLGWDDYGWLKYATWKQDQLVQTHHKWEIKEILFDLLKKQGRVDVKGHEI